MLTDSSTLEELNSLTKKQQVQKGQPVPHQRGMTPLLRNPVGWKPFGPKMVHLYRSTDDGTIEGYDSSTGESRWLEAIWPKNGTPFIGALMTHATNGTVKVHHFFVLGVVA